MTREDQHVQTIAEQAAAIKSLSNAEDLLLDIIAEREATIERFRTFVALLDAQRNEGKYIKWQYGPVLFPETLAARLKLARREITPADMGEVETG